MPRPKKPRVVQWIPVAKMFIPEPPFGKEEAILPIEGFEAIRLADYEGLDQEEAAEMMNVSRQTFGRILASARSIVADALVKGKILRIEGGDFVLHPSCGRHRHRHRHGCCHGRKRF